MANCDNWFATMKKDCKVRQLGIQFAQLLSGHLDASTMLMTCMEGSLLNIGPRMSVNAC